MSGRPPTNSNPDIQKIVGILVRESRKLRGVTQIELAKQCDVVRATINAVEGAKSILTLEVFMRLQTALNVDLSGPLRKLLAELPPCPADGQDARKWHCEATLAALRLLDLGT